MELLLSICACNREGASHASTPSSSSLSLPLPPKGDNSDKKAFAADAIQRLCKQECAKCVAAGSDRKQCPSDSSPLPQVCSSGLQFSSSIKGLVDRCIDIYRKDASALSRAKGC